MIRNDGTRPGAGCNVVVQLEVHEVFHEDVGDGSDVLSRGPAEHDLAFHSDYICRSDSVCCSIEVRDVLVVEMNGRVETRLVAIHYEYLYLHHPLIRVIYVGLSQKGNAVILYDSEPVPARRCLQS